MATSTAASTNVIECLSGRDRQYTVARPRNATSTEWDRSNRISRIGRRPTRARYHAMSTTIDHPIPISSRFAPVMLANAREHAVSPGAPGG